ncbi:MAG: heavy metal translocating P-type ATPase [Patescibacteria group bacterium]
MKKLIKMLRFSFKNYRSLTLVILVLVASLALDLTGKDGYAHLVLGVSASIACLPLAWGMWQSFRDGSYGLDILALTAIVTSVILKEYWAGMVIVLMLTGGETLEDYAERRATSELSDLLKNKPKTTRISKAGKTIELAVRDVKVGDKVIVQPGEVVPVDGEIIEGASNFDESSLTGESQPVNREFGQQVLSGSINMEGLVTIRAIHSAADSQYEQIIKLVRSASASQSPFVRLADRYSIPFTAVSFIIAGTVWIISGDPLRFLQVIVVATPCPLLLGAPIALISGMSRAAKHGIIIKTGSALERLATVQTVAFDKTGTLTVGLPTLQKVITYNKFTKDEVLSAAASLERNSNHVLAKAIVNEADKNGVRIGKTKQVKEHLGLGLEGRLNGKTVLVGRYNLLNNLDVEVPKSSIVSQTATYVSVGGRLAGVFTFADQIRPESSAMLTRLKKSKIKHTLMLTGDNQVTADKVAKELGINVVQAECLPADKIHAIEAIKHKPVAFVGDGVNDAPVLTAADVGIALGARGSTAASESADVVIMLDDVSRVASSIEIAKRTFYIAQQSIFIGILISLGLMGIFATGRFKPVYGAAIQELVDIIVIINALRAHGSWRRRTS